MTTCKTKRDDGGGMEWPNGHKDRQRRQSNPRQHRPDTDDKIGEDFFWDELQSELSAESDPWEPFNDLTRVDSSDREVAGAFNGFEPVESDEESNSTDEHDLIS